MILKVRLGPTWSELAEALLRWVDPGKNQLSCAGDVFAVDSSLLVGEPQ
jgi:hypothetical protein